MEKNCSKSFSDACNFSGIEEQIIKHINTLKPFYMKPRKAIPKKLLALEEENNFEKEINLTVLIILLNSVQEFIEIEVWLLDLY